MTWLSVIAGHLALILLLPTLIVKGQDTDPDLYDQRRKEITQRHVAPVSAELPHARMPAPSVYRLRNGLRVVFIENHRIPRIDAELIVAASSLSDPADLAGVAEAVPYLLKAGSADRWSSLPGTVNVHSQYGSRDTRIRLSVRVSEFDALLNSLSGILKSPRFAEADLEKWKRLKVAELQRSRNSPFFLAQQRFRDMLYAPDARAVTAPSTSSLARIHLDDITKYYKAHYVPRGTLLAITGDIPRHIMRVTVSKHFSDWLDREPTSAPWFQMLMPISDSRVVLVDRPGSSQTLLLIGNRALDRRSAYFVPSVVLSRILCGGPAGRLFRELRERQGYAYDVSCGFTAFSEFNHFYALATVRPEVTGDSIASILSEFRSLRTKAVSEDDLSTAKESILAAYVLEMESQSSILGRIVEQIDEGLTPRYWAEYPVRVRETTIRNVTEVALKVIPDMNAQIVAVGDARRIRSLLAKYGPVAEYTIDGTRADAVDTNRK